MSAEDGTFDLSTMPEDYQRGYRAAESHYPPMGTWRGSCGHLWDRAVEDTDECPRCLMARALAESEKRAELGDAWAAAEAALPGGWFFTMFISVPGRSYVAHARDTKADEYTQDGDGDDESVIANRTERNGRGPTPAAALRALAAALLEGEPDAR